MFGQLVVMGTISDVAERSGVKEGRAWRMRSAYIVGRREVYEINVPDELASALTLGASVAVSVRPREFRGVVSYEAVELWDGELPAAESASRAA